jgi:stearoyl-CoA desaturase (delta-9 desaturase)
MGEGWHNNHHANPGNYSNKERWWEFDPSGIIIALIKKTR